MSEGRPVVISHYQAGPLLRAWAEGRSAATTSPDLGLSSTEVALDAGGATLTGGDRVTLDELRRVEESKTKCFVLEGGTIRPVERYSELTARAYSLMPTFSAPTLLISGIPMHRIKDTDPHQDTLAKVKSLAPVIGRVLDTATGLGYTAIESARSARRVVTIELDPAVLEVAQLNPWSAGLFDNPRITQLVGSSYDLVQEMADSSFERIIHDPPTLSLAGELYSAEFYWHLHRLLSRGGRLFHYVGDPSSKSGRGVTRGVARRLADVGFRRVVPRPEAFGLVAYR